MAVFEGMRLCFAVWRLRVKPVSDRGERGRERGVYQQRRRCNACASTWLGVAVPGQASGPVMPCKIAE